MEYVNGNAASFSDLQTALQNACVANGWVLTSGILSKNGCFFKLSNASNYLRIDGGTGQSGSTLINPSPYGAMIGSVAGNAISFSISYEINLFANPDEVYCVINYNSDFYQQISFGKSDVPGIGGTGAFFTGSMESDVNLSNSSSALSYWSVSINSCGNFPNGSSVTGGLFSSSKVGGFQASYVHCGLDTEGWRSQLSSSPGLGIYGINYAAGLLTAMPNLSNNANVLIPIKAITYRYDNGRTIVANLRNSRYMRIDNVFPGEIITFGSEQWKCFPFYRKSATERNGIDWPTGATHSGTFGYAIKYTGI